MKNRIEQAIEKLENDQKKVMEEVEKCGLFVSEKQQELEAAMTEFRRCRNNLGYINGQIAGLKILLESQNIEQ